MRWFDSESIGKSGFVQCRLVRDNKFPPLTLAEIAFYAPDYEVEFTRHVMGYVAYQHNGPMKFKDLETAKKYATAIVVLS